MKKKRKTCRMFVGLKLGRCPSERPRRHWEDNISKKLDKLSSNDVKDITG
jgi:hypothetical protein